MTAEITEQRVSPLIYNNIVGGSVRAGGRRDRSSAGLSAHQANGVIEAALHARRIGLPFNRHVTIRLERAGIPDRDAVKVIGAFLTRVRDWLRKKGHRTAFAWVRENGAMIGSHVHILLHLPAGVSFGHRPRRWIEATSGKPYRAGTIRTKRISEAAYDDNLGVLVGYLCKGASPDVAETLGLERRKPGGTIIGKRAGWSENIGLKARRMWAWRRS
jgi:hypothetical protein